MTTFKATGPCLQSKESILETSIMDCSMGMANSIGKTAANTAEIIEEASKTEMESISMPTTTASAAEYGTEEPCKATESMSNQEAQKTRSSGNRAESLQ